MVRAENNAALYLFQQIFLQLLKTFEGIFLDIDSKSI